MNKETIFEHRIKDLLQNGKGITDEEREAIAQLYEEWEMKQPKDPTPERTEHSCIVEGKKYTLDETK